MAIEMPGMMRMTGHVSVTRGRTCDIAITSCLGVSDDDQRYLHRGDVEEDRYIPLSPGTPHTLRDTRTLILDTPDRQCQAAIRLVPNVLRMCGCLPVVYPPLTPPGSTYAPSSIVTPELHYSIL